MNANLVKAIGMLAEPGKAEPGRSVQRPAPVTEAAEDDWRWRLRMPERIAEQMEAARFGVKHVYLIGSTKNATAGPAANPSPTRLSRIRW